MKERKELPIISIIVPTFNQAKYIKQCLHSLQSQTLKDIEIIVSDDASKDDTIQIVTEEQKKDSRIKLLRAEVNQGTFVARNKAIAAAGGKYIMFVDSDDYISRGLCEELLSLQNNEENTDILHFSSQAVDCGAGNKATQTVTEYMSPYKGALTERELVYKCFVTREYGATLTNKLFSAEVCKKAIAQLPDIFATKGEDILLYFALAMEAKSYRGTVTQNKYYYNYGLGGSGQKEYTVEDIKKYAVCGVFFPILENYQVCDEGKKDMVSAAIEDLHTRLVDSTMLIWKNKLENQKKAEGLKVLFQMLPKEDVLASLYRIYKRNIDKILPKEEWESVLTASTGSEGKTVAIYGNSKDDGKIATNLCDFFQQQGYRVVNVNKETAESFSRKRALDLYRLNEEEKVDLVCLSEADASLFYDMLYWKLNNRKIFCFTHELNSDVNGIDINELKKDWLIYTIADKLIVSSEEESRFWTLLGVNATEEKTWKKEIDGLEDRNNIQGNCLLKNTLTELVEQQERNRQEIMQIKESLQKLEWLKDIVLKTHKRNLKIALYPFGAIGKNIKMLLEDNDLQVDLIVDNYLAKRRMEYRSLTDLNDIPVEEYLFVICSNKPEIYNEIRVTIKNYVKEENIYDLYPKR